MQEAAISGSLRGLPGARVSFRVSFFGRLLPVMKGFFRAIVSASDSSGLARTKPRLQAWMPGWAPVAREVSCYPRLSLCYTHYETVGSSPRIVPAVLATTSATAQASKANAVKTPITCKHGMT